MRQTGKIRICKNFKEWYLLLFHIKRSNQIKIQRWWLIPKTIHELEQHQLLSMLTLSTHIEPRWSTKKSRTGWASKSIRENSSVQQSFPMMYGYRRRRSPILKIETQLFSRVNKQAWPLTAWQNLSHLGIKSQSPKQDIIRNRWISEH